MSDSPSKGSRRNFFLTASAAGAVVASASLIKAPAPAVVAAAPKPAPEKGGGYSLSEHVKRYDQTTRVCAVFGEPHVADHKNDHSR